MEQLPNGVYYIIGTIIVANIGTILAIWIASLKMSFWAGEKLRSIDGGIAEAKNAAVRAHKRIDIVEEQLR